MCEKTLVGIRYQVKGYRSVWITTKYSSKEEMLMDMSFEKGVFKVFSERCLFEQDFVFIEELYIDDKAQLIKLCKKLLRFADDLMYDPYHICYPTLQIVRDNIDIINKYHLL